MNQIKLCLYTFLIFLVVSSAMFTQELSEEYDITKLRNFNETDTNNTNNNTNNNNTENNNSTNNNSTNPNNTNGGGNNTNNQNNTENNKTKGNETKKDEIAVEFYKSTLTKKEREEYNVRI